jgi:hypothetical protein
MTDVQMSKESAIQRIRDLGVAYIGSEEWRTLNAAQVPTRRPAPVMKPVRQEVPPEAELSDEQCRSLFPPTP